METKSEKLKNSLMEKTKESQSILDLFIEFPDLQEYHGRWNSFLCSSKVNLLANQVDFRHSCGCCPDAVLYAMPYIEINNIKIYSIPTQIVIGEQGYCGEKPYDNWEIDIRQQGFPEMIIEKIKTYFQDNQTSEEDND